MLPKPMNKKDGFQMYRLAKLQYELNDLDIRFAQDADFKRGVYRNLEHEPLSDTEHTEAQARYRQYEHALKKAASEVVSKNVGWVPMTHGLNLLLKNTGFQDVNGSLKQLERHLDDALDQSPLSKQHFSIFTYRDEVESAIKGFSQFALRVKFVGSEAAERVAFDFVRRAMADHDLAVEPAQVGENGNSLRSFFEAADTLEEALRSTDVDKAPFSRLPLSLPYTSGPDTWAHDTFMAESLKPLYEWELIEDNQRETGFFIAEHSKDFESAYQKYETMELNGIKDVESDVDLPALS